MKLKMFILLILVNCFAVGYSNEFTLTKGLDNYSIKSDRSLFEMTKYGDFSIPDSVSTVPFDSLIVVPDRGDSIYVFIAYYAMAFFCLKQHGTYNLLYGQGLSYEGWFDLYCLDVNRDGNLDFVYHHGDESNDYLTIRSYDYLNKKFRFISNTLDYYGFIGTGADQPSIADTAVIKNNKLYILYDFFPVNDYPSSENGRLIKYGVLDYSRDKTREIYFRPIGVITPEKWLKFCSNKYHR